MDDVSELDDVSDWRWKEHVQELERVGSNYKFKCAYCERVISGGRSRLAAHFVPQLGCRRGDVRSCPSAPAEVVSACKSVMESQLQSARDRKRLKATHAAMHAQRSQRSGSTPRTPGIGSIQECQSEMSI